MAAAAAAAAAAVAGEEGEKLSRSSPTVKPPSESKALDLLQQHASQYKSKSPSVQDNKAPHERERDGERPRSSPSQRILPSHHHLGYPLLSGQYDLSYASGEHGSPNLTWIRGWFSSLAFKNLKIICFCY